LKEIKNISELSQKIKLHVTKLIQSDFKFRGMYYSNFKDAKLAKDPKMIIGSKGKIEAIQSYDIDDLYTKLYETMPILRIDQ